MATIENNYSKTIVAFSDLTDLFEKKFIFDLTYWLKYIDCLVIDIEYEKYDVINGLIFFKTKYGCNKGYISQIEIRNMVDNINIIDFIFIDKRFNRFSYLTENEKKRKIKDSFQNKGYMILSDLDSIKNITKYTEIILITKDGEKFNKSLAQLDNMGISPNEKKHKISFGERATGYILYSNNIEFEYQKFIKHKNGKYQYFDFYLEYNGRKICIEYNGEQHYKDSYFCNKKLDLKNQLKQDNMKLQYCNENNIEMFEISYKKNDMLKINKEIEKIFNKKLLDFNIKDYFLCNNDLWGFKNMDQEIIEYYKNHTCKETSIKFGVSSSYPVLLNSRYGIKKGKNYIKVKIIDDLNNEITFNCMADAQKFLRNKNIKIDLNYYRKQSCNKIFKYNHKIFLNI